MYYKDFPYLRRQSNAMDYSNFYNIVLSTSCFDYVLILDRLPIDYEQDKHIYKTDKRIA